VSDSGYPLSEGGPQLGVEPRATYHHIVLRGDLDSLAAEPIRRRLEELVEAGGHGRLVLDLAECSFVDSAGLGSLVAVYKRCHARGGPDAAVVLLHASPDFLELLQLTQLAPHLPCFDSVVEAQRRYPWIGGAGA